MPTSTQELKIFRETTLPATLQPFSIYMIAPAARPDYVEIYVTSATGEARRVINKADIDALILSAVTNATELLIVEDIAERDALTLTATRYVFVKDATADATVDVGGATYLYDPNAAPGAQWIKISESESLDVQLTWAAIEGKPTSTPAQIDSAVANAHTHANKTELDKIGEDADGNLTYAGNLPSTGWNSTNW
jgi:hypothetical protein